MNNSKLTKCINELDTLLSKDSGGQIHIFINNFEEGETITTMLDERYSSGGWYVYAHYGIASIGYVVSHKPMVKDRKV
jgi:hypothetical protein